MKKRSKLFLLISGIIFAVGIVVCLVGVSVSSSEDMQLYAQKVGDSDDRGYVYDFGDGSTDKIKISVADADVSVYGGCERSYVEIINFNENLCSYSGNDAIITFREAAEVEGITGIWENGLTFKGLRYLLRFTPKDRPKKVNVYLESSEKVKAIEIKLQKGDVTVSDLNTVSDFKITLESGKVSFSEVITDSAVKINASGEMSTDVTFARVNAHMVEINANRSRFKAEGFSTDDCKINVETGSAQFDFKPMKAQFKVSVFTKGKLTVNGAPFPDSYVYPDANDPEQTVPEGAEEEEPSVLEIKGSDLLVDIITPAASSTENTQESDIP